jgi:hypothetical protein
MTRFPPITTSIGTAEFCVREHVVGPDDDDEPESVAGPNDDGDDDDDDGHLV